MSKEHKERLDALRVALNRAAADPVRYNAEEVREHFDRLLAGLEKKPTL